jgi:hypothetical protein
MSSFKSFKSFKEYLSDISYVSEYDPFIDEWDQFVDIENQTNSFRELSADQIFGKSKKVDILEPIQEIKKNKCSLAPIQSSITKQSIKPIKNNNINIYNTHIHLYLQQSKLNYNLDTKPNNKFYVVVIMCAYISFNFLFT